MKKEVYDARDATGHKKASTTKDYKSLCTLSPLVLMRRDR